MQLPKMFKTLERVQNLEKPAETALDSLWHAYLHATAQDIIHTYSSLGNLTSKSDLGSYTYAGDTGSLYANPHAATAINGVTQTYTKSGNLMGNGTWNYRWDYRGQLTRATSSASALSSFGYDYTGSRVYLKEGSQATTTFPNKLYSTQGATTTKHIYAGNQLIATVENTSGSGGSSGDTGLKSPSATGEDHNQWSTPSSAYASNNDYAFEDTLNHKQDYYNFTFGIPSGATINGIEVKLEAKDQEIATGVIGVELSHNGGTTYTSSGKDTGTLTGSDAVYTLGGSSDTWGRSWSDTEFSNTNFRLRVNADTLYLWLDHVQAKVYYTTGGSGATTTIAYVHTDHLGGTSAITNDHKEIIQTSDYYPFGATRFNTQKTDFNERRKFTGYELDNSTGLNYAGARYQNPGEGRFTSQDPASRDNPTQFIADPQQFNSYSYARNNPLRFIDPMGLWINNENGSFIAEKGDTLSGLQQETGRNWKDTGFSRDPRTLQIGERVSYARTNSSDGSTVNSTAGATAHYYTGGGASVNLGSNIQSALKNSPEQKMHQENIISGKTLLDSGNYRVNLQDSYFFVGQTPVDYNTTRGTKFGVTTFTGFVRDGFWDPFKKTGGDGIGPKYEVLGGEPYSFIPYTWVISYPKQK